MNPSVLAIYADVDNPVGSTRTRLAGAIIALSRQSVDTRHDYDLCMAVSVVVTPSLTSKPR